MGATTMARKSAPGEPEEVRRLAVSYMGWPLHYAACLLWMIITEVIELFRRKKKLHRTEASDEVMLPPLVRLRNLPQSEEYFVNKRGRVIHVRSYCPADVQAIRAVVLFSHGYGAHCNSPRKHQMGLAMPEQGLCMFQMDLEGHGYSGGERAYIEDYNHWVDDYRQLLELVAGGGSDAALRKPSHQTRSAGDNEAAAIKPHFFTTTAAQRKRLGEVPIFVAGESLGGALSILLGLSLHETNHPLLPRFKGQVLLAPAIKGNPPAPMLVALMRHLVVPLIPRWQIPSCLESVNRPDMCVLEVDERRHANHDILGYPGGLGWGGTMRFRTGLNLIDLTAEVSRKMEHVEFPFLIMHDPGDGIVHFDSSEELTSRASTPHGSPRGRELRPMKGWLHCLLTNCPELAIKHLKDWVLYQTELHENRQAGGSGGGEGHRGRTITHRAGAKRKTISPSGVTAAAQNIGLGDTHGSVKGDGACSSGSDRAAQGGERIQSGGEGIGRAAAPPIDAAGVRDGRASDHGSDHAGVAQEAENAVRVRVPGIDGEGDGDLGKANARCRGTGKAYDTSSRGFSPTATSGDYLDARGGVTEPPPPLPLPLPLSSTPSSPGAVQCVELLARSGEVRGDGSASAVSEDAAGPELSGDLRIDSPSSALALHSLARTSGGGSAGGDGTAVVNPPTVQTPPPLHLDQTTPGDVSLPSPADDKGAALVPSSRMQGKPSLERLLPALRSSAEAGGAGEGLGRQSTHVTNSPAVPTKALGEETGQHVAASDERTSAPS